MDGLQEDLSVRQKYHCATFEQEQYQAHLWVKNTFAVLATRWTLAAYISILQIANSLREVICIANC